MSGKRQGQKYLRLTQKSCEACARTKRTKIQLEELNFKVAANTNRNSSDLARNLGDSHGLGQGSHKLGVISALVFLRLACDSGE